MMQKMGMYGGRVPIPWRPHISPGPHKSQCTAYSPPEKRQIALPPLTNIPSHIINQKVLGYFVNNMLPPSLSALPTLNMKRGRLLLFVVHICTKQIFPSQPSLLSIIFRILPKAQRAQTLLGDYQTQVSPKSIDINSSNNININVNLNIHIDDHHH